MLPFGRGKMFGNDLHGFSNFAASGWSVDSIVTLQSGFPITPQLSYNPSNNGDTRNPVRPFINPDFHGKTIIGKPSQWFNPSAFLAPPANSGFYGNLGRDTLNGPGLATWDFAGAKDTTLREGLTLQFRGELFNILNRANFNTPNLIIFTPIRSLRNRRRHHQHLDNIAPGPIRPEAALVAGCEDRNRREAPHRSADGPSIAEGEASRSGKLPRNLVGWISNPTAPVL